MMMLKIREVIDVLQSLGFDTGQTPPCASDGVYLERMVMYTIDNGWYFEFGYPDITVSVSPADVPDEIWEQLEPYASAGHDDFLIFLKSDSVGATIDLMPDELRGYLAEDLAKFRAEVARVLELVEPWTGEAQ